MLLYLWYDKKCFKIKMYSFKIVVYGFEIFVIYILYGNFGFEVRMILKVIFDL